MGGRLLTLDHRPWDEGYKAARQGDYDGTLPYIASADRREDCAGLASRPLTEVLIRVFSRAADAVSFHSEQDLRGLIACRPRGYYTHDLDPMLAEGLIELRRADSIADCFRGLAEGGMTSEMVQRALALQGTQALVRFRSWSGAQQAVADGSHPATFPWIKTDRRERDFRFSDPLYAAPVMIFTAADSDLAFTAYNDLRNTRSCKPEGYYRSDIDHLVAAGFISIIEAPDLHACFRRVAAGDADFLTVNRFTGWHELQRSDDLDATDFRMLERPIAEIELRVMAATDADELLEHINAGLDALARSGELQAIQERHIETHLTTRGRHAR